MLSGETAVGRYPVGTVEMMDRIVRQTETYHWQVESALREDKVVVREAAIPFGDAIADATAKLVADTHSRAVLVISNRGMTAATISAARPAAPVVARSRDARICRRMSLMWGVLPHLDTKVGKENPNGVARRVALELKLAEVGEFVVLVRGFHSNLKFNTPTLTLLAV